MITTSSYKIFDIDLYSKYSISGDRGKKECYQGKCYPKLAPKMSFWKEWHDNIGKISEGEYTKFYIREYWIQVLSKLDPEKIYEELDFSTLLCYEENTDFCHRHIVAAWFELFLNISIKEVIYENGIKEVSRPEYIKEYLEEIIKENINMKGYNSLRALYLFEKGNILDTKSKSLEGLNNEISALYRQSACEYRCEADEIEAEYKENNPTLRRNKKED